MSKNIKILIVAHKPFKKPEGEYYLPIHAGRKIALERSKDGKIDKQDFAWMLDNTVGDDSGENISDKNRYYCECSALYWAWKNFDKINNPEYIGLMHYRRHFIFNDEYYQNNVNDNWHKAFCYINEHFINESYLNNIGLNDENINQACQNYDIVVTKDSQFDLVNGYNIYNNYENTIPGAKIEDLDLMLKILYEDYPQYKKVTEENIYGYKKSLYQMFIMRKDLCFEYCEFLFGVLAKVEAQLDMDTYTVNGKRTLGYLAEILLAIFVWQKQAENAKILKLGVTEVEYPYEKEYIEKILHAGCPSILKYYILKFKSYFLKGNERLANRELRQNIRRGRRSYKKLTKLLKNL